MKKLFTLGSDYICFCACFVHVNYDLSEYLPTGHQRKRSECNGRRIRYPGTARVMVGPVTLYEAKAYKDRIADIDGVGYGDVGRYHTDVY